MPRIKTVFNSQMVAHVWAQSKQPHGRNPQGNMSFDGSLAYSYAQPVAHIVMAPDGTRVALFTDRKWSVTTSRHVYHYRRASNHLTSFTVPDLLRDRYHARELSRSDHDKNIYAFIAAYKEALGQLMRAPSESWRVRDNGASETRPTAAHDTLHGYAATLEQYARKFALPKAPLDWLADADAVIARRDKLLSDPQAIKRRAAREEKRAAERAAEAIRIAERAAKAFAENQEKIGKWRDNAIGSSYFGHLSDAAGNAMLRVSRDGREIETSWGARVPIGDARRVIAFYQSVRAANSEYHARNHAEPISVGEFTLTEIAPDGTMRAGCHTISAAEIATLAQSIGA